MLQNDLDRNVSNRTRNWAGDIKRCLESYGFQDVWTAGVVNETSCLCSFKRKMVERFQQEWYTKVSSSDRFTTYSMFKSSHVAEKYILTINKFWDTLVRLRFGINELKSTNVNSLRMIPMKTAPFVQVSWKMKFTFCSIVH